MRYEVTFKYVSTNTVIVEADDITEAISKVQEQQIPMLESCSEWKWTAMLEPNLLFNN